MNLNLQAIASLAGDRKALQAISEKDFSVAVREYAEAHDWRCHYQGKTGGFGRDGKTWRSNAPSGWPDLTLARTSDRRLMVLELKTMKGRTSPAQDDWLQTLAIVGVETDVVRPSDAAMLMERLK